MLANSNVYKQLAYHVKRPLRHEHAERCFTYMTVLLSTHDCMFSYPFDGLSE